MYRITLEDIWKEQEERTKREVHLLLVHGLTLDQAAQVEGVSKRTVQRDIERLRVTNPQLYTTVKQHLADMSRSGSRMRREVRDDTT